MAKANNKKNHYAKKRTAQGSGKFTKKPGSGGERFSQGFREGSPPAKAHRRKKPYRGQGR